MRQVGLRLGPKRSVYSSVDLLGVNVHRLDFGSEGKRRMTSTVEANET